MYELYCKKHRKCKECLAGESGHPDNWYCPDCDAEEEEQSQMLINRMKCKTNMYPLTLIDFLIWLLFFLGGVGVGYIIK